MVHSPCLPPPATIAVERRPASHGLECTDVARIIAFVQRKGGSGKTTTCLNLAGALAELERRVLLIDLDPQCSLSASVLGVRPGDYLLSSALINGTSLADLVRPSGLANINVVPADPNLAQIELNLGPLTGRERLLRDRLRAERALLAGYDYLLLDAPPLLGFLTTNCLNAAMSCILPLNPQDRSSRDALEETVASVQRVAEESNYNLRVEGILLGQVKLHTSLGREACNYMRRKWGDLVFEATIPDSIAVQEALNNRQPVTLYSKRSAPALAYRALCRAIVGREDASAPVAADVAS
jgi:chromosome partitioning protein